jgi:hypothetical protein
VSGKDWFLNFHDRTNNTHRHETWMDGYFGPSGGVGDGGASKYLPLRGTYSPIQMLEFAPVFGSCLLRNMRLEHPEQYPSNLPLYLD